MESDTSSEIDRGDDDSPSSSRFRRLAALRELGDCHVGSYVKLYGWIQGIRIQKALGFIDLGDGTTVSPVRCLAVASAAEEKKDEGSPPLEDEEATLFRPIECPSLLLSDTSTTTGTHSSYQRLSYEDLSQPSRLSIGCSVMILGYVDVAPTTASQCWEVKIVELYVIGGIQDPSRLAPITKSIQQKPPVALRQYHHSRFRAPLIQQLMSIRSQALFAVHEFMHREGVPQLDPSVLTCSDCEGAGEVFKIQQQDLFLGRSRDDEDFEDSSVSHEDATATETSSKGRAPTRQIGLTVSSQLPLEAIAMGTGSVYTCQKSFRAEKSDTSKHLAEFLHVEFERYLITLEELMDFTERFLKTIIETILTRCAAQYEFLSRKRRSPTEFFGQHSTFLRTHLLDKPFVRITHSQAVDILLEDLRAKAKVPKEGCTDKMIRLKFSTLPQHGQDLESEHEKYLLYKFGTCVFVTHWPSQLASFYMKEVDGDSGTTGTCESFDLLAPFVGELFGGSMREWRHDVLLERMKSRHMDVSILQWYLDLRTDGSAPHGGWGMGFDRLVMLLTKATSIRDVTPYPVYYGHCPY